jgi:hypothetical protein
MDGRIGTYRFFSEAWVEAERTTARPLACTLRRTDEGLHGAIREAARRGIRSAFVYHDGRIHTVDNELRVARLSSTAADGADLRRAMVQRYRYHSHGETPLSALLSYTKNEALLSGAAARAMPEFPRSPPWALDSPVFRRLGRGEAVVVAFYEETTQHGGLPVERVVCVRQVVRVDMG